MVLGGMTGRIGFKQGKLRRPAGGVQGSRAGLWALIDPRPNGDARPASWRLGFSQAAPCESVPSFMAHVKLHIPGPVEVSPQTFAALSQPMMGHRGQGFKDLYAAIQPKLQSLLGTRQFVYLSTSSAWGVMEGAVRNLTARKVLNCMCGAFSDKWL